MKRTLTILLVCLSSLLFAQNGNPVSSITAGLNRFPLLYYRPVLGPGLGDAPFPFHISANIPVNERLSWRAGVNFSSARIPFLRGNDFCLGLEGGAEYAFLKPESKWMLNGSGLLFVSHYADDFSFERSGLIWNSVSFGPELMVGYKITDEWAVCSAFNVTAGFYKWGEGYDKPAFNLYAYRQLSAEVRYTF